MLNIFETRRYNGATPWLLPSKSVTPEEFAETHPSAEHSSLEPISLEAFFLPAEAGRFSDGLAQVFPEVLLSAIIPALLVQGLEKAHKSPNNEILPPLAKPWYI
jgi:hypothetical protein